MINYNHFLGSPSSAFHRVFSFNPLIGKRIKNKRFMSCSKPFSLPSLPYDYIALEPYIDTQTMYLHHKQHHQAYVSNLNVALEGKTIPDIIQIQKDVDNYTLPVRNNGNLSFLRFLTTLHSFFHSFIFINFNLVFI